MNTRIRLCPRHVAHASGSTSFNSFKSTSNLAQHGIDFDAAQALWRDDRLLEVQAKATDEPRWLVVERIAGVAWPAVVTYRDHRIRSISARRARVEAVPLYRRSPLSGPIVM